LNQILDNLFKKKTPNDILKWLKIDEKSKIIKAIEKSSYAVGYDVKDLQLCDFIVKGIIDPVKVTKSSLQAAFSISITIMSTDVVIAVVGENGGLVL
jgi:chaperonin GroEL (HSP60 family)